MEFKKNQTTKIVAAMLLIAAISQPIYTVLYQYAPDFDRKFIWGLEALLFVLLAAFAGSALSMAKRCALGFSAIAFSAVLNVIQVGVGLTQFGPARAASQASDDVAILAGSVYAFSFFSYNAAKILLGLAAVVFGAAKLKDGGKLLGGTTILVGVVALVANTLVMMFGLQGFLSPRVAGFSGVVATLLLALCLFSTKSDD